MKVLYIASIVGKSGFFTVRNLLPRLKEEYSPDFIIANGDMASVSGGIEKSGALSLHKMGIDVITAGDHVFANKGLRESLASMPYILRPCNLPKMSIGCGIFQKNDVAIISLLGRIGQYKMLADNPFCLIEEVLKEIKSKVIIIDFVSHATGEKKALFFMLKGCVSAIIGGGTLVATNDFTIYEDEKKKTAYITDAGRTGSYNSVSGYIPSYKIEEYLTCLPNYPRDCWKDLALQGVFIEFDGEGNATKGERVFMRIKNGKERNSHKT